MPSLVQGHSNQGCQKDESQPGDDGHIWPLLSFSFFPKVPKNTAEKLQVQSKLQEGTEE
jgi:hypothetical protein